MSKSTRKKTAAIAHKTTLKESQPKKKKRIIDKKPHVEFIASLLTIPSLILVLILNFNNLKTMNGAKLTPTPTPIANSGNYVIPHASFFTAPIGSPVPKVTQDPLTSPATCDKSLGPVSITSPDQGDTVSNNPVEVDIFYDNSTHCDAVWSYSVNGKDWSDYDNRSVALYNLPDGPIKFQLRVKSIAGTASTTLSRDFTYNGQNSVITPTNASGSAH